MDYETMQAFVQNLDVIVDDIKQEIRDASNRITKAILIGAISGRVEGPPQDVMADVEFYMQRIGR